MFPSTLVVIFMLCIFGVASAVPEDTKPECPEWAAAGECDANPEFMQANCATSCAEVAEIAEANAAKIEGIESFFDLEAQNIDGETASFSDFEGSITVITNVASYCGYTDSHYQGLKELYERFADDKVEILVFPCNQFGRQEPGTAVEISEFCEKKGFQGTVMEKVDVNGPNTHPVYLFLKKKAGPETIQWNFATYYVVDHEGYVQSFNGVEPMELVPYIEEVLEQMAEEAEEL